MDRLYPVFYGLHRKVFYFRGKIFKKKLKFAHIKRLPSKYERRPKLLAFEPMKISRRRFGINGGHLIDRGYFSTYIRYGHYKISPCLLQIIQLRLYSCRFGSVLLVQGFADDNVIQFDIKVLKQIRDTLFVKSLGRIENFGKGT